VTFARRPDDWLVRFNLLRRQPPTIGRTTPISYQQLTARKSSIGHRVPTDVVPLLLWELGQERTAVVSLGYLSKRLEAAALSRSLVQIKCQSEKKLLSDVFAAVHC